MQLDVMDIVAPPTHMRSKTDNGQFYCVLSKLLQTSITFVCDRRLFAIPKFLLAATHTINKIISVLLHRLFITAFIPHDGAGYLRPDGEPATRPLNLFPFIDERRQTE
jgi:hypothetical protein